MRSALLALALAACGTDDPLAGVPQDCQPGQLHWKHTLALPGGTGGEGTMSFTSYYFENVITANGGTLDIGDLGGQMMMDEVFVHIADLVPDGGTVAARGYVRLSAYGIDAGNCNTGALTGHLQAESGGYEYRFLLQSMNASPYCGGAAIAGKFEACFRTTN